MDAPSESDVEELRELAQVLAIAAVVWLSVVGAINLYWATGGTTGAWTLWGGRTELSGTREPWVESLLRSVGLVALVLAALAFPIARGWRQFAPRRTIDVSVFLVGLTLVPYVAVETVLQGFVLVDALESDALVRTERAWRLLFWNPWWVVGVILFCVTVWTDRYVTSNSAAAADADA